MENQPPTEDIPTKDDFVNFNKIDELAPAYLKPYDFNNLITSMSPHVDVQRQGINLIGVVTTLHNFFPTADHPLKTFTSISPSLLLTVPLELASPNICFYR